MLHIDCICVGKLKEDYLKNAILEYSKRLSKYCIFNIIELQDEKVPTNLSEAEKTKIIEKESNNILANIKYNFSYKKRFLCNCIRFNWKTIYFRGIFKKNNTDYKLFFTYYIFNWWNIRNV